MKILRSFSFLLLTLFLYSQELPEVKVAEIKIAENYDSFYYGGRLEANRIIKQYSPISGLISEVYFYEGDYVRKDQVILTVQKKSSGGVVYNPYEVRSVYDGIIIKNPLIKGEEVFEKSEIINIADISKYKLKLLVSDKDIPFIKSGNICFVRENKKITGNINKTGIIPDEKTGLFEIEISFLRNSELFIGKYLTVEIRANYEKSMTINYSEVVNKYGKTFLYVLQDDIVNLTEIKLGKIWGDKVSIVSGVKAGDIYVSYTPRILNDKDRVKVVKEDKDKKDKKGIK